VLVHLNLPIAEWRRQTFIVRSLPLDLAMKVIQVMNSRTTDPIPWKTTLGRSRFLFPSQNSRCVSFADFPMRNSVPRSLEVNSRVKVLSQMFLATTRCIAWDWVFHEVEEAARGRNPRSIWKVEIRCLLNR
jgi:hypothetical protein